MSDILASVGLGQLTQYDRLQTQRRKIAERYIKNLKPLQDYVLLPASPDDTFHAWHLFILQLRLEWLDITRDQFIVRMAKQGIECGLHYEPIPGFTYYRKLGYRLSDYPNTERAARRIVTLPLFPSLKPSDVDYICEMIGRIIRTR